MEVKRFAINGLLAFKPRVFTDDRGCFFESFNQQVFEELIEDKINFVQDNQSLSKKHVLRGLHFQKPPFAQGKLVRVLKGTVLDVAVDLRKSSATYGQHQKIELTAENGWVFWIPAGFAHGFLAMEDDTIFAYKCTNFYNKESEDTLNWNDETLAIDWGINTSPLLSEKDQVNTTFNNYTSPF